MDQRQRRVDPLVLQVGEERRQLVGDQHPLVDERACRQAGDVAAFVVEPADRVLDPLAQHERAALQVDPRGAVALDEDLAERRHGGQRLRAQHRSVRGHVTPPEHAQALLDHDVLDGRDHACGRGGVRRQKHEPGRVAALGGQAEVHDAPEEPARHLDQDPGAVARVGLRAARPAVVQIAQGLDAGAHDVVASVALHVHDERHTARIVLEARIVEALLVGWGCARLADVGPPGRVTGPVSADVPL